MDMTQTELEFRKKDIKKRMEFTFTKLSESEKYLEMFDELSEIIDIYLETVTVECYESITKEFLEQIALYEAKYNL